QSRSAATVFSEKFCPTVNAVKTSRFLERGIPLPSGLEQLNWIAVGIFYLYLLATGTNFHFVPEMKSRFFHCLDLCGQIVYPKHDAIPTSGFLLPTIRHLAGARRAGATKNEFEPAD